MSSYSDLKPPVNKPGLKPNTIVVVYPRGSQPLKVTLADFANYLKELAS